MVIIGDKAFTTRDEAQKQLTVVCKVTLSRLVPGSPTVSVGLLLARLAPKGIDTTRYEEKRRGHVLHAIQLGLYKASGGRLGGIQALSNAVSTGAVLSAVFTYNL